MVPVESDALTWSQERAAFYFAGLRSGDPRFSSSVLLLRVGEDVATVYQWGFVRDDPEGDDLVWIMTWRDGYHVIRRDDVSLLVEFPCVVIHVLQEADPEAEAAPVDEPVDEEAEPTEVEHT
jgi:hypothetical protein